MLIRCKAQVNIAIMTLILVVLPLLTFACTTKIRPVGSEFKIPVHNDCSGDQLTSCHNIDHEEFIIPTKDNPAEIPIFEDFFREKINFSLDDKSLTPDSVFKHPFIVNQTSLFAQKTALIFYEC